MKDVSMPDGVSPIEDRLSAALRRHVEGCCGGLVTIKRQVAIANYRADFLVTGRDNTGQKVSIVVECDGHEFHEKTKEQADRDKGRDRVLQSLGHQVVRFTGSDIHRNADRCAMEVRAMIALGEDRNEGWWRSRSLPQSFGRKASHYSDKQETIRGPFTKAPRSGGFRCMRRSEVEK